MISGIDQLNRLVGQLAELGRGRIATEMRTAGADVALRRIRRGFATKTTPYGGTWRARKRPAPGSLLVVSRTLLDGIAVRATTNSIRIVVGVVYAATHQFGDRARGIPRRQYLPSPEKGWPAAWLSEMERAARRVLRAHGLA